MTYGYGHLPSRISAWQLLNFLRPGTVDITKELHKTITRCLPCLTRPDHLLIKTNAASINPLDVFSLYGYGASSFHLLRLSCENFGLVGIPNFSNTIDSPNTHFPLTLGRDFAGQIVGLGPDANSSNENEFSLCTQVVGATWPFLSSTGSGAFSQYLVCPAQYVTPLPADVSPIQGAALAYSGLTAWSALVGSAGIRPKTLSQITHFSAETAPDALDVLINGATGGVGLIVIQLCKLWGHRVHAICRSDAKALELMKEFEVDEIIVYPDKPPLTEQYDLIIDCVRQDQSNVNVNCQPQPLSAIDQSTLPDILTNLKPGSDSRYINLNPPVLRLTDQWGPFLGTGLAFGQYITNRLYTVLNFNGYRNVGQLRWAFFQPNKQALNYLLQLIARKYLRVPIDTVYPFDELPAALTHQRAGGVRGKLVIDMTS